MEYIKIKNTDISVSRLALGGCPLGGHGWGETAMSELEGAVYTALDSGITFFDTADTYGLGQSEILLGKALESHRNEVIINTKFGVRAGTGKTFYDNSPEWIRTALEASLRRLKTDYIDIYTIHYRDGVTPLSVVVETLEELRRKGYIRCFGLSNIHKDELEELQPYADRFVTFQDEYSLACRKNEADMLELSSRLGMMPVSWGSLGQGILTGKFSRENLSFGSNDRRSRDVYVNFHGEKLEKNLQIVEHMRKIAEKYGKPVSAVAIRFILDFIPESVVLCGAKRPSQVLGNVQGTDWKLDAEDLKLLDEVSAPIKS